jgi:hypothetical protein
MNKYQRLIVVVALIDVLVMFLFAPFNDTPLTRGSMSSFEGFYPLIAQLGQKPINRELLTIEILFVAINLLSAYLCLRSGDGEEIPEFNFGLGILCFTVVNLAVILLFPPFEPYQSLFRNPNASFDSFYFIWGDRSARALFIPLLYLEVVFLLVNVLAVWLLFNTLKRSDEAYRSHLVNLAETMDPVGLEKLSQEMRRRIEAHHAEKVLGSFGGNPDQRHVFDPNYAGEERRKAQR